ncbi:MAG: prolipoprotein diacylglyceryl transferase [Thermoguttaceae bacterium]
MSTSTTFDESGLNVNKMRQTLFYIPSEVMGFPIFGWGIALIFLVGFILVAAIWRFASIRKFDSEIGNHLGLLLFGGVMIVYVVPNILEPSGFPIRGYGFCLLIAILASVLLVAHLSEKRGTPKDIIFSLAIWSVFCGLIGARLFYVTEYWNEMIVRDMSSGNLLLMPTLFSFANVAKGGLVVLGSIIGGSIGAILFMLRYKMPILATFDDMAPAMMLGLAIGRIGCFLNGCCFGGITECPVGVIFPPHSPAHLHQISRGDLFYYGQKWEDATDADGRPHIKIVDVTEKAAEQGFKPGMTLLGICGQINGKNRNVETKSREALLFFLAFFEQQSTNSEQHPTIRFDLLDKTTPEIKASTIFAHDVPSVLPVHPTQLYSSIGAGILCCVLLALRRCVVFQSRPGLLLVAFLFLYSLSRFSMEFVRNDEDFFLGTGLTISQNICLGVFALGIVLLIFLMRKNSTKTD